ncbi:kinase non-catalytic C-lobe domain-containing protein 1 isoform X1 [Lepisosteus oculatus]|uniref:kinase non-catalytic C-lobe domain-containing protein 1 isoform X1 n=1 Tax=Lepisosteus oculatus TaxID=7918 RepID=UPI0037230AF5
MGTFETAVAVYYEEEDEEEEYYEFEPLPTVLEDEENVSLADILSLRDNCLTEQEIWAVCLECALSLRCIAHSALFHTLCITPDTLAFNAHGNVCFMEQLSDDPEGAFVPPEFDRTGNTFEAHVYSLGSTLAAAIEYVIEPELEPQLSHNLKTLLNEMQQERPEDRPNIEAIIRLGELHLMQVSSANICRKLSAIGRRVLSIESVGNFQDGSENSWNIIERKTIVEHKQQVFERNPADGSSSTEDLTSDMNVLSIRIADMTEGNKCAQDIKEVHEALLKGEAIAKDLAQDRAEKEGYTLLNRDECTFELQLESTATAPSSRNNSTVRKQTLEKPGRTMVVLNHSHSNHISNPTSHPILPFHVDRTVSVTDLSEVLPQDQTFKISKVKSNNYKSVSQYSDIPKIVNAIDAMHIKTVQSFEHLPPRNKNVCSSPSHHFQAPIESNENISSLQNTEFKVSSSNLNNNPAILKSSSLNETAANNNNPMKKSMFCLNEETRDEWISLKELLSRCGRPLTINELFALCHTCLSTLQTYIDYPAYICMDSVYVGCEGEVLFLIPKKTGSCDTFYIAPEFQQHGIVTEKVCVYGIAAVLWAAAKFNISPNQKLPLPKTLKRLLLEMAKRTPIERPSIAKAQKSCSDYLLQHGTNAEKVWADLINSVHQLFNRHDVMESQNVVDNKILSYQQDPSGFKTGFVPIAGENKLSAVQGPVPCQYSVSNSHLPAAFTSLKTHFRPIVLSQNTDIKGFQNECKTFSAKQHVKAKNQEIQQENGEVLLKDIENEEEEDVNEPLCHEGVQKSPIPDNDFSSTPSSGKTLINSPSSISSDSTNQEKRSNTNSESFSDYAAASALPENSVGNNFNNFLLRQDPKTGLLTLLPVQIAVTEPIPGLEFNIAPLSSSCQKLPSGSRGSKPDEKLEMPVSNKSTVDNASDAEMSCSTYDIEKQVDRHNVVEVVDRMALAPLVSPAKSRGNMQIKPGGTEDIETVEMACSTGCSSEDQATKQPPPSSCSHQINSGLQKVVHLIKEEFAFDGYLENGVEDLAMGEYILSLKDLQHGTFCSAISEKFCDLYWDKQLLDELYKVVNRKHGQIILSSSKALSSLDNTAQLASKVKKRAVSPLGRKQRKARDACQCSPPDLHGNRCQKLKVMPTNSQPLPVTGNACLHKKNTEEGKDSGDNVSPVSNEECAAINSKAQKPLRNNTEELKNLFIPLPSFMGKDKIIADLEQNYLKRTAHEMDLNDSSGENPSDLESSSLSEREGYFTSSAFSVKGNCQLSLDYSEDIEDTDSLTSERMPENTCSPSPCPGHIRQCRPGWSVAFYGEDCFHEDVQKYVKKLGRQNESQSTETKMLELQQQLMIETRNLKKTRVFYQKLLQQERKNKGSEAKIMLPKVKAQLEEMTSKVEFLQSVKKYLEVLYMEQWGLDLSFLPSLATSGPEFLDLKPSEDNSMLSFQSVTIRGKSNQDKRKTLQSGTPLGLISYLFARNAAVEGYIQQFLYTFRYFCTPEDFLQFLIDKLNSVAGANQSTSADCRKVYSRSLDVLQAWVEDCKQVDFSPKSNLLNILEDFIVSKVVPLDSRGESLLVLAKSNPEKRRSYPVPGCCVSSMSMHDDDETKSVHSLCKKISTEDPARKSFQWRISKGAEPQVALRKEKPFSVAAALPRPCYTSLIDEMSSSHLKTEEKYPFFQSEYSVQQTAQQLTLLQQEMFQGCHPVHFLNSRALGVKDKTLNIAKAVSPDNVSAEGSNLFASEMTQDPYILQLLKYADHVSNWVSAETVICDTVKAQTGLLSKFLLIAKLCYESRNFATAMQILGGLENVIVRQLPAWKNLSAKVCEIMEELKAVQVFLKSDNLCLMEGEQFKKLPTIPAAHILTMHVQQLEIGALTMANGAFKWSKLRNIAKIVSQVHAFQENAYNFIPDLELQAYLKQRIAHFSGTDIPLLAAENNTNFHQIPADKHSRKIQDTFRRMKATFQ